jgi:outer membrane protein assembly factor BamA
MYYDFLRLKNSKHYTIQFNILTGLVIAFILASCNPTKYVPADKNLLNKYDIEVVDKSIKPESLKGYVKQKPNKRIFGWIRFHLGLYNLSNIQKEKGIHKFLRKIGEEPVIYDPYLTEKSMNQLGIYMKNKGYYNASISDSVIFKGKKANVTYYIKAGKPYTIKDITYAIEDTGIRKFYFADTINSLIKRGDLFDKDLVLQNERTRIERIMKTNGYYNFSREYVFFNWDSLFHKVNVEIQIENPINTNIGKEDFHKQYKVRKIIASRMPDPSVPNTYDNNNDTIDAGRNIFLTDIQKLRINPKSFVQFIYIQSGRLYNESSIEETYTHVSSLNLFKLVDIKFTELTNLPDTSNYLWLDCNIRLSPAVSQSYSADLEGTNSSGNIGGGVHFKYRHINLFGNAELLDLKVRGSIEFLKESKTNKYAPGQEFGIESNIKFPTFLIPVRNKSFIKKYNPKTLLSLSYNYQDRPEFIRTVANIGFGYQWKQSRFQEHIFRPFEINYVDIKELSDDFEKFISGKYIENSYRDHLITNMSYSYIYNSQNIKKNQNFDYFRVNIESAGNTLSLFNKQFTKRSDSISSYYQVLGIQYSQYLKTDFEYKYYNIINPTNNFVYRIFVGAAYPYANARAIPFEKRYFSGGANGLRGWQARSLGPGSSIEDTASWARYPNSTGDIKIELNFEYRFKLFWKLEGAFFMDAGNIWAIRKEDNREGGWFQPNSFYKELAMDSGLGFRLDFSFFIFRTDIGMKMRDPSQPIGERWILGNRKLVRDDFAFQIGIGYPF